MSNPYLGLADTSYWRRAVAGVEPGDLDPVTKVRFRIRQRQFRVVTAGSCFAQHIARRLSREGFRFYNAEPMHPLLPADMAQAYSYGVFSARYGNVYTARQLLQLFKRAYGMFEPKVTVWRRDDGRYVDPFRPQIQPEGFATIAELEADRKQHFAAVRRAFEQMHIFVFTFGLTECWADRADGAVYPVCPGVAGGRFSHREHEFLNLSVQEIVDDMKAFFELLLAVNPRVRTIVTVSPVPLVATAATDHVLVSTTYSKSVLRVACQQLKDAFRHVDYFPSYEIITSNASRGRYFANDLRSVTEEGVDHVMKIFMKHYTIMSEPSDAPVHVQSAEEIQAKELKTLQRLSEVVELVCDEEALDPENKRAPGQLGKIREWGRQLLAGR